MEKFIALTEKLCPQTLTINTVAIGLSLTDVEIGLKLLSYAVAIIWTSLRIAKEMRDWNKKNK